jgi:acyl-CoA dehydrogenase
VDLTLPDELTERARAWHEFAEGVMRPAAARHDEEESIPWDVMAEAARRDIYSVKFWADGLSDPTGLHWLVASEELFWGCAGIGLQLSLPGLALAGMAANATNEQLYEWAPRCFGTPDDLRLAAYAISEPGAGSDVASLSTIATREGDDWVLNGRKIFVGNGGIADVHVVVASVDPDLGHAGQGTFIVTKDDRGVEPVRQLSKLGMRASYTGEFALEDCRVPGERLLGGVEALEERMARARDRDSGGDGSSTLSALERSRPVVAAQAIGVARAAFEYAREYATERHTFGQPIIEHAPVAYKLADMALEIDAARLLAWRGAWMGKNGHEYVQGEGSMSKLKASEVATRVTEQAIQVLGGHGYIDDHPVEKWYRDAKVFDIYEGTSEIQRLVISRAVRDHGPGPLHLRYGHA